MFLLDVTGNYLVYIARFLQLQHLYVHGMSQFTVRREDKAVLLWIDISFTQLEIRFWCCVRDVFQGYNILY